MSTVPKGLSYDQASRLRLKYGFNELPEEKNKGLIKKLPLRLSGNQCFIVDKLRIPLLIYG